MRTYRRITYEDRCQIYALRTAGITQAEIGKTLGFSQGTVSRELARNTGQRSYRFQQAHRTVSTAAGSTPAAQADGPCPSRPRP
ncbi:MAG: helix-turn-helix domain-containing protein [Nitrospira sp.]